MFSPKVQIDGQVAQAFLQQTDKVITIQLAIYSAYLGTINWLQT